MTAFEEDVLAYQRELPQLIGQHGEGRFALLEGARVHGVYDTYDEAVQAGCSRFWLGGFLAKEILSADIGKERYLATACRT